MLVTMFSSSTTQSGLLTTLRKYPIVNMTNRSRMTDYGSDSTKKWELFNLELRNIAAFNIVYIRALASTNILKIRYTQCSKCIFTRYLWYLSNNCYCTEKVASSHNCKYS